MANDYAAQEKEEKGTLPFVPIMQFKGKKGSVLLCRKPPTQALIAIL